MTLVMPIVLLLLLGGLDGSRALSDHANIDSLANRDIACAAKLPAGSCDPVAFTETAASQLGMQTQALAVNFNGQGA